jgi:hypothetical protein
MYDKVRMWKGKVMAEFKVLSPNWRDGGKQRKNSGQPVPRLMVEPEPPDYDNVYCR